MRLIDQLKVEQLKVEQEQVKLHLERIKIEHAKWLFFVQMAVVISAALYVAMKA